MTAVGIEETTFAFVEQKGVIVPAVPEATHDIDELAGAPIALVLRKMLLAAEVLRSSEPKRRAT
jgi:hypothetical protein